MGTKRKTYICPPPSYNFGMKVVALLLSPSSWLCFFGEKKKWGNWKLKLKLKLEKKGRKGFLGDSEVEEDSTSYWVVISLCSGRDDNGDGSRIWCLNCYDLLCNFKRFIGRVAAQPPRHSLSLSLSLSISYIQKLHFSSSSQLTCYSIVLIRAEMIMMLLFNWFVDGVLRIGSSFFLFWISFMNVVEHYINFGDEIMYCCWWWWKFSGWWWWWWSCCCWFYFFLSWMWMNMSWRWWRLVR